MSNQEHAAGSPPNAPQRLSATTILRRDRKRLLAVFAMVALAMAITGYVQMRRDQGDAQAAANERLAVVAGLKLRQISNWREERLSDAHFFSRAPFVAADLQRLLEDPSEANRESILRWLKLLKGGDRYYEVALFDSQLNPLIGIPNASAPSTSDRKLMEQILKDKEVAVSDLNQEPGSGLIHLDILFPIFRDSERQEGLLGFGYLKLNAQQFLFPLVQTWPTASRTAETLLLRREGDQVLLLNALREQPNAAMQLRLPLSSQAPSARVMRGETNLIEGIDYEGTPVVAVGHKIPGTKWAMVAKMDKDELYAPSRRQAQTAGLVTGSLLLIGAFLTAALWWRRGNEFLIHELATERERLAERTAYESELERMNRLYAALSQINETIVRARSREELFQQSCIVLVEFGGFQMAWLGWVDPQTRQISAVAQHGEHLDYLQDLEIFGEDRPEGGSPIGRAIRHGKPCVLNDPLEDVRMKPWHEVLRRFGWRSIAAFPIRLEGQVCAALAVYSKELNHFGPKEIGLLNEVANDVSFGIDLLLNDDRRQHAEEQLRGLNAELEKRVLDRTAQLEAKNRALESFTYSVSHDLKAPLRGIAGFSQVLIEDHVERLDDSGKECVHTIVRAAERMNQLIDDLLSYSRLEIQKPESAIVDVRELVDKIIEDFAPQVVSAKTQVTVDVQGAPLRTDPQGLEQALRNLIGNAIKFSSKVPQPRVQITGRDQDGMFRLEVRDNGIGFDMQYQEKLFQIFQRLNPANDFPGTGIGLAIVRKAVERVGGRVRAESEPGKGAVFTLEIPRQ